ncbi:peptidylprolyl isomerase [Anthocerotibacter panamensis]|uniref:peptidylprolyl isomerase n=1 Tax=Anthocerotibacter panamensis TaxID=2857077 RepID=UPI001C408214|nr:peptidylprolyl isomerase [Anthocerotibacter panamensis]
MAALKPWVCLLLLTGCQRPIPTPFASLATPDPVAIVVLEQALPPTGPQIQELGDQIREVMQNIHQTNKNWTQARDHLHQAQEILNQSKEAILTVTPLQGYPQAQQSLSQLNITLAVWETALQNQNFPAAHSTGQQALWNLATLRLALLTDYTAPPRPPAYSTLPRKRGGWALVRFTTDQGNFKVLVDGYNAPTTAGAFLAAVQAGHFTKVQPTQQRNLVLLPTTVPRLPLEVRPSGQRELLYDPRQPPQSVLSFAPPGTIAFGPSGAGGQFFLYFRDQTGANLREDRYTTLGYVVAGLETVARLQERDHPLRAEILDCPTNNFGDAQPAPGSPVAVSCLLTGPLRLEHGR